MKAGKVGADDFAASGHAEAEDLAHVPRAAVAADPTCTRVADDFLFAWPDAAVEIEVTTVREHSEGVTAELAVSLAGQELHWGRLALASTPARGQLVKRLAAQHKALPWGTLVEQACRLTVRAVRVGEPVVCLMPIPATETRHLIPKLALAGETNVVFGDGGTGKSLLALALGIVVASPGAALPLGIRATATGPVLYLDWESCLEEHQDREHLILTGLGIREAPPILYRAMSRPLADEAGAVRAEISRHHVSAVIVDSLAPACGAEPEGADAAIRCMNAMRSFGPAITRLVLAHVSKASAEQRSGSLRPFGSVFVQNLARSVWEIRRADDDGSEELVLGLYHRKVNRGRLFPALALRLSFATPGALSFAAADLAQEPELIARVSLRHQLLAALRPGARHVADLAEALDKSEATIRKTLSRMAQKHSVTKLPDGKWGIPA